MRFDPTPLPTSTETPGLRPWQVFGTITVMFLLICVWRWEIVHSPPYHDCAVGLFTEANFLYETGFDFQGAYREEPWGTEGGAISYGISVLPTFVALLMTLDDTGHTAITAYHLFNFWCAAIVLTVVFAIVRRQLSTALSAGVVVAMATTPLFASQVDMLGMELPMTAAFAIALWAVSRDYLILAGLAAAMCFACKTNGMIASIAVVAVTGLRLLLRPASERRRRVSLAIALACNVGLLLLQVAIYRWSGISDRLAPTVHEALRPVEQNPFLFEWAYASPEGLVLTIVSLVMVLLELARGGWRRWQDRESRGSSIWSRMRIDFSSDATMLALACLTIGGTLLAIRQMMSVICPRYWTITLPCVYVLFGVLVLRAPRIRRFAFVVVTLLIVWNCANLYESLFPEPDRRMNAERSLAYLTDHQASIEACRRIEAEGAGARVVTGSPFVFYLALPRLGFVSRPQFGYTITAINRPEFANVLQMFADRPCDLILIATETAPYYFGTVSIPGPGPDDRPIYTDKRRVPLSVYRKDLCNLSPAELSDWYVDHLWYARDMQRAMIRIPSRARILWTNGFGEAAKRLLAKALADDPTNIDVKLELARQLIEAGQVDQGLTYAQEVALADDRQAKAFDLIGQAYLQQDKVAEAISAFEKALQRDPDLADARYRLAVAWQLGNPATAEAELRVLLERDPRHGDARFLLGVLAARAGKFDDAVREFDELLRHDPACADAAFEAGLARRRQQRNDEAERYFREAIARAPNYAQPKNSLGILLLAQSQFEPAERLFRESIAVSPEFAESYNNLAILLASTNRAAEAEENFRTAIRLDRNYVEAYNNLGLLLSRNEQWAAARDCFVKALAIQPDHVQAQQNLRSAEAKLKRNDP